jgi:hypothetical protein
MKGNRNHQPNMMAKNDLLDPKLMSMQQTMQALLGPHSTIDPLTGKPIVKDTTTVH